jgi:hypothetical protein
MNCGSYASLPLAPLCETWPFGPQVPGGRIISNRGFERGSKHMKCVVRVIRQSHKAQMPRTRLWVQPCKIANHRYIFRSGKPQQPDWKPGPVTEEGDRDGRFRSVQNVHQAEHRVATAQCSTYLFTTAADMYDRRIARLLDADLSKAAVPATARACMPLRQTLRGEHDGASDEVTRTRFRSETR